MNTRFKTVLISTLFLMSLAFTGLSASFAYADEKAELSVLPVLLHLDGVGELYGAAAGYQNIGARDFDVFVGATSGDVKAGGISFSNFNFAGGLVSYQFASVSDAELETQYGRGSQLGVLFKQNLSGTGHHIGYQRQLKNPQLSFKGDLQISEVKFEAYADQNGREIDINFEGLHDVASNQLGLALNWDSRVNQGVSGEAGKAGKAGKADKWADGYQVKNKLSFTQGRIGLADQGQWDFQTSKHLLIADQFYLSAYLQGSHSFILAEEDAYDTDAEIRSEIDGQCGTLSGLDAINCQALEDALVASVLANNNYGTAAPVGGVTGLRSYPQQLFKGANRWLEGLELEYALPKFLPTERNIPVHLVAFVESAQVNDRLSDLFDDTEYSVGAGLRTYVDETLALRLEVAHGDNGDAWLLTAGLPY